MMKIKINKKKFGKLIKKIRKARQRSKDEVLNELNTGFGDHHEMSLEAYNNIENGTDRAVPEVIDRLACVLKVPVEALIAMTCIADDAIVKMLQKRMKGILVTAIKCQADTSDAFSAESEIINHQVCDTVDND